MSQNVSKLRQKAGLQTIEKNILFMTQEELAEECGVDRKTIQRDIEKWRVKGGFKRFLVKEFFEQLKDQLKQEGEEQQTNTEAV